jgi:hypothetical protein
MFQERLFHAEVAFNTSSLLPLLSPFPKAHLSMSAGI